MSLTLAPAPLSTAPGAANYTLDSPKHRLFLHPFPRRVRAELGGEVVLDTRRGQLLHETGLLPRLYVPEADVRLELLTPTGTSTHCPFKGDASYWTVKAGGKEAVDAFWTYAEPKEEARWLRGLLGMYEERFDRWLDEDEEIRGKLRDPYHRVDARRSSRHVRVLLSGSVVAETDRPVVVSETGLPNRFYVPREDVAVELQRSDRVDHCPYKGEATYWSIPGAPDGAWSYEAPLGEALTARGHVSFSADDLVVEVDGERVPS